MKKEKLKIVYEDKHLVIIDKKPGVLTVGTDKDKEHTLFHELLTFQKQKNKNNKIFIVHRLDRDTSGLVVFAKSERIKKILQDTWDNVERKYIAVVNGLVINKQGVIESYLMETKTFYVYSTSNKIKGKYAKTNYSVIKQNKKYSLLDINIKTGRKNQIRVHLNDIGHSIVGDKKYGAKDNNPLGRLALYAYELNFIHPVSGKNMIIKMPVPNDFEKLVNKKVSNK